MARKDSFTGNTMHCVNCTEPIPPGRKSDAVTCSPFCSKARRDYLRSRVDQKSCRYCQRPSTPEERARYQAWRRAEKKAAKEGGA
jgi:predicted nucleic acid-binding Zn ribbon protein